MCVIEFSQSCLRMTPIESFAKFYLAFPHSERTSQYPPFLFISSKKNGEGCPIALIDAGEVAIKCQLIPGNSVTEVGRHSSSASPSTLSSSEESQVFIYCWERQLLKNPKHKLCFELRTFSTSVLGRSASQIRTPSKQFFR